MIRIPRGLAIGTIAAVAMALLPVAQAVPAPKVGGVCKSTDTYVNTAKGDELICVKKVVKVKTKKVTTYSWALNAKAGKELKIGVPIPQSGLYAPEGGEVRRGYEMAVEAFGGRAGGRKITLVFGDAFAAQDAISETERLITREKVEMFVGTYATTASLSASETAAKYGTTFIETHAITDSLTERGLTNYFRVGPRAIDFAQTSADFISQELSAKLGKKVWLEHEQGLYGASVTDTQEKLLKAAGLTVSRGKHNPAATDVTDSVLAAKAANPDIWMITSYAAAAILLLRTAQSLNFNPKAIVLVGAGDTSAVYKAVGSKFLTDTFVVAYTSPKVEAKWAPGNASFYKNYQTKFNAPPLGTVANTGFTGMTAALKLIRAAKGKVSPADIAAAGQKVKIPLGGQPNGFGLLVDNNRQNTAIRLLVVQWRANGTVPAVWPNEAAQEGEYPYLPGN